jgi:hypothetical protein
MSESKGRPFNVQELQEANWFLEHWGNIWWSRL